ncbi:MAG: class I SAM-dependent methyltransferase, partial [Candidatus Brockarchaeota archaeon]|nr:class I SAM-dependent methyltransferase [Candidatus Brockarchaeota archaeon]
RKVGSLLRSWMREESAPFSGWDFSRISGRCVWEPPPWSYEDMARKCMSSSDSALDLGTGGGEVLLSMKGAFPRRTVATEDYAPNAALAHERLKPCGGEVVKTDSSRLEQKLPFANESFDLVIDRHACFNALEVARVLERGGVFLTEQVDGRDCFDLCQAFGVTPQWPFFTLDYARERIESSGLAVEVASEWEGKTIFKDVGAIAYYLKAVPWIVPGFKVETHLERLLKLQDRIEKEGELPFSRRLFILKACKV